jgi:hypothetical protein
MQSPVRGVLKRFASTRDVRELDESTGRRCAAARNQGDRGGSGRRVLRLCLREDSFTWDRVSGEGGAIRPSPEGMSVGRNSLPCRVGVVL